MLPRAGCRGRSPPVVADATTCLVRLQSPAGWQSASRNPVRVGEAVEAFAVKIRGYLPGLQRMLCVVARLSRSGRRFRLLPGEDLPPPIGVGGQDPSAAAEALECRNAAIHWPSRPHTSCGRGQLRFPRLRPWPCRPTSGGCSYVRCLVFFSALASSIWQASKPAVLLNT